MNYAEIKTTDIANGEGVRVSLFVSGCTHHCKNCFNSIAWDFDYGKPFTEETKDYLLTALSPDYIAGLSLLGGEPFEPQNQKGLLPFVEAFKKALSQENSLVLYGLYLQERRLARRGKGELQGNEKAVFSHRCIGRRTLYRRAEGYPLEVPRFSQSARDRPKTQFIKR